jgi:hypothetical protein
MLIKMDVLKGLDEGDRSTHVVTITLDDVKRALAKGHAFELTIDRHQSKKRGNFLGMQFADTTYDIFDPNPESETCRRIVAFAKKKMLTVFSGKTNDPSSSSRDRLYVFATPEMVKRIIVMPSYMCCHNEFPLAFRIEDNVSASIFPVASKGNNKIDDLRIAIDDIRKIDSALAESISVELKI